MAKRALLDARLHGLSHESPIPRRERHDQAPLSFGQERLWFAEQVVESGSAYNVSTVLRLTGAVDEQALEQAWGEIVRRHEILRTKFGTVAGSPVQLIAPFAPFVLATENLSNHHPSDRDAACRRRIAECAQASFDLAAGPLFRAVLLRLDTTEYVLVITLHHTISDDWSVDVLLRELWVLYVAFSEGRESPLAPLPVQYADYAAWHRKQIQGEKVARHMAYWKTQLAGAPALLPLVTDRPRPPVHSFRGARERIELSCNVLARLRALGQQEGATLFMVVLAAFQILLAKYTSSHDIVVGSPIAGRTRRDLEGLIGFFVNMLVLRTDLGGDPSFREAVRRVRGVTLGAFEHHELPFEAVVEELHPQRTLSQSPLFQVVFMLEDGDGPGSLPQVPGVHVRREHAPSATEKYDLRLSLAVADQGLRGQLSYSADLFERRTITQMCAHLVRLVVQMSLDPERRLSDLSLLDVTERTLTTLVWNSTDVDVTPAVVHQQFERQVARTPDAVAVASDDGALSYAELNARANQLAHHLQRLGVGEETRVAVSLKRGLELVVGLLAVLKAGGVYVPLDPRYPAERLMFMLTDSDARVLLTEEALRNVLPMRSGVTVLSVDGARAAIASERSVSPTTGAGAQSLAYVMYTSGSTGKPKGVAVEHRGIVRLVRSPNYMTLGPDTVMLQAASISFDGSTVEIWGPLLNGGRLALMATEKPSVEDVGTALLRHAVTVLHLTAAFFQVMTEQRLDDLFGISQLLPGGDVLPLDAVKRVQQRFPALRIINGYGPTENTVFTCCHTVPPGGGGGPVPIGVPVTNTRVYVLDLALQPLPIGVAGELYCGGSGVARGYLNRPGLTASRFIPDPFGPAGARLYRTGDRARWRADGTLDFLGRVDRQVKIRGFRIEPGELSAVLATNPAVRDSHVLVREDMAGDKRLVAYVTGTISVKELREYVRARVPEYMVPAAFVIMERFPLTPNGKVDGSALPAPDYDAGERVAPATFVEVQLLRIWEKLLGVEVKDPTQSFFDLGGHSLLAMRLVAEVEHELNYRIPVATFFGGATVRQMAEAIEKGSASTAAAALVSLQPRGSLPPLFLIHTANGRVICYVNLVRHLGTDRPIWGLQDLSRDFSRPVADIAREHLRAIRSVRPHGPYCLAGWSFGGLVAYEVASLLEREGERVAFLGLFDTRDPSLARRLMTDHIDTLIGVGQQIAAHVGHRFLINRSELEPLESDEQLSRVLTALHAQTASARIDVTMLRQQVEATKARGTSGVSYLPGPFLGTVTVFRASDNQWQGFRDRMSDEERRTLGWERVSSNLDIQAVPGTHETMVNEPHVRELARRMSELLAEPHDCSHTATQ